jgi:hypothetical protein
MPRTTNSLKKNKRQRPPYGTMIGLFTGALTTLLGVSQGLEPHVICWRSLVSAVATGLFTGFGASVIYLANLAPRRAPEKN